MSFSVFLHEKDNLEKNSSSMFISNNKTQKNSMFLMISYFQQCRRSHNILDKQKYDKTMSFLAKMMVHETVNSVHLKKIFRSKPSL